MNLALPFYFAAQPAQSRTELPLIVDSFAGGGGAGRALKWRWGVRWMWPSITIRWLCKCTPPTTRPPAT